MEQEKHVQKGKERSLKIHTRYFNRVNSWCPAAIPEIRLCGKWLQDIGFGQGQTIKVQPEENKITITVDEAHPEE